MHGKKAKEVYNELRKHFMTTYDESGTIGKDIEDKMQLELHFVLQSMMIPKKGTVTVRERDTMEQKTVKLIELKIIF